MPKDNRPYVELFYEQSKLGLKGVVSLAIECFASDYAHVSDEAIRVWFKTDEDANDFLTIYAASIRVTKKRGRPKKTD